MGQAYLFPIQWGPTLTSGRKGSVRRTALFWAVVMMTCVAFVLPMVAPPASAVTEYRYEIVPTPPTPLDYKGVSWSQDGSEAIVVGGVQALLAYDPDTGIAWSMDGSNWSTASQTLEAVTHTPDGRAFVSSGRLDGSAVMGDLWEVMDDEIILRASIEGDIIQSVAASPNGRLLAIGALGSLFEYKDGELEHLGSAGDVVLYDIAWAPDGSGAIIVGAAGTITWFDAIEGTLEPVPFTSTHPLYSVDWRPGTMDAWAVGEGSLVVEVNSTTLEASRVRPFTPRTEDSYGIAWHPEADIALLVGEEGVTYLWRLGVFTKQIMDLNVVLLDVMWNPVGDEALVVGESGTMYRYAPWITSPNRAPDAVISSPDNGHEVEVGGTITFDGTSSSDPDGDPLSFTWSSNSSGLLSTEAEFRYELPLGAHRVTLYVDDGQGHNSTDQVSVNVVKPVPKEDRMHLEVVSPRPGSMLKGEIVVSGTVTYELGPVVMVDMAVDGGGWRPAEGIESWSISLDTDLLEDGVHSLEVRATAEDGVFRVESFLVEVRNIILPEPPLVPNITLRLREQGTVDQLLSFAVDGEGLSSWILVWSFGDGSSGQGEHVSHAYNEEGTYQITLELWFEGNDAPAAIYSATVVVISDEEDGLSIEAIILLSMMVAGAIYVIGFYGGQRAFRRD